MRSDILDQLLSSHRRASQKPKPKPKNYHWHFLLLRGPIDCSLRSARLPFSLLAKAAAITTAAVAQYHHRKRLRPIRQRQRRRKTTNSCPDAAVDIYFSPQFRQISQQLGQQAFERLFRMSPAAFVKLSLKLQPYRTRQEQSETVYRSATFRTDVRLAITLRVLARTEVLNVALTYSIACGTVYNILHGTVRVLDTVLQFPRLSRSREEVEK